MAEYTQAAAYKNALYDVAVALWGTTDPGVQIAFGHPGLHIEDDLISFGEISSTQAVGPFSPNRPRDETLTLTVIVSIFRHGGPEMEQLASDRAYKLLGDLENYVRKTDTTLGGIVRHCFLDDHISDGSTDPEVLAKGRLVTVAARFVAVTRITTS